MSYLYTLAAGIRSLNVTEIILCIASALMFILAIEMHIASNKAWKSFNSKNYHAVIAMRKRLDVAILNKIPVRNLGLYALAMAYFETGDDEHFLYYMDKVKIKSLLNSKYYMLAIHALMTGNGQFMTWRECLITSRNEALKDMSILSLDAIEDFLSRKDYNRVFAENIVYFCRSDRVIRFITEKKNGLFSKDVL